VRVSAIAGARSLLVLAVVVGAGMLAWGSSADAADRVDWAVGADFQQTLAEPCDILWAANPLRQAFKSLSLARKVAILVDRRVDPSQKLDVSLNGVPLESALQTIAQSRGLGVARLGAVMYVGPPAAAEHLRQIAALLDKDTRHLPAALRLKYRQTKSLAWDDLATPRELLARLADESGLKISGLELVPHDLWAAADLPPLPLTDRLALVAVQFDLAFKIADRGEGVELTLLSQELRRQPQAERGAALSRSTPRPTVKTKAEPRASLEQTRVDRLVVQEKPLGPVLRQLADRLGLELKIDQQAIAAAGISLDQRVSVHVENATIDELLRQLLKSTDLTFHRRERVVEIVPAEK
jgi:hypothetical protein